MGASRPLVPGVSVPPPSVEQFGAEVEEFLAARLPLRPVRSTEWGVGDDSVAVLEEHSEAEEQAELQAAKQWRQLLAERRWHWLSGPPELGGAGLSEAHRRAYVQIAARYDVPEQRLLDTGIDILAPALQAHGTEYVRHDVLPKIHTGELVVCQLFSEPGAGSDLAGAATRAQRVDGGWLLTGQKIWTSNAHFADWGECLARTSPDKPKHRGLSMFLVDMSAPGVEVRPIVQMTGGSGFNEVFLENCFVRDEWLLGEVDNGWQVARTTLMNERSSIGENPIIPQLIRRLGQLVEQLGSDELLADRFTQLQIEAEAINLVGLRQHQAIPAGEHPGPEMSLGKLLYTSWLERVGLLACELLGRSAVADDGDWGTFAWATLVSGVPGLRLAGGTDEIMRTILAERVLGLPREQ
jgi:alkylation response protein AidB-like acyl-CoA dehydrogenase